MAQLAGASFANSPLMTLLHASPSRSPFVYTYQPVATFAVDTDTVPLGSGNLTNNAFETHEADVPNTHDLVTGCTLVLNVPAIVNVSSGTCDLAGSATNASSEAKVRAYVDGSECDSATRDKYIVARASTLVGTAGFDQLGYLPFASIPSGIKEGDYFEAYPTGTNTVAGTLSFKAANTVAPAAGAQFVDAGSLDNRLTLSSMTISATGYLDGGHEQLIFGPTYTAIADGVANHVTFGQHTGILTFVSTVTGSYAAISSESVVDSFTFTFTYSNPDLAFALPLVGRIGRIDTTNFRVYDRMASGITKIGGVVAHTVFSRDTNRNAHVGDSSVEIPASDPHVQFTKNYQEGPNRPAATSQGLLCPAAGFASDIAAFYQPWCPAQFVQTATLVFDGVCADTITGQWLQVYHDLLRKKSDKNHRLLNACTDTRVLKARARQPQQFEVLLPFFCFLDATKALNMERFKYTRIQLRVVSTPYSRMIANGCGSSDFKLTITSDNALGGTTARTLVTKAGSQVGSTHAFCDGKAALTYASATNLSPKDIRMSLRFDGIYLPKAERDRLLALTPKSMVVVQHSASDPMAIKATGQQKLVVPGNNAITSITLVTQLQSTINQGRFYDFGGHALAGTGTLSGAHVERAPVVESVRLVCQGKNRTEARSAQEARTMAHAQGAAANAEPDTDYYMFALGNGSPYESVQNINAQTVPDIHLQVSIRAAVFSDNSLSGGLDGKSKVAAAGSAIVDGGECVNVRAFVTQANVLHFAGDTVTFAYPC